MDGRRNLLMLLERWRLPDHGVAKEHLGSPGCFPELRLAERRSLSLHPAPHPNRQHRYLAASRSCRVRNLQQPGYFDTTNVTSSAAYNRNCLAHVNRHSLVSTRLRQTRTTTKATTRASNDCCLTTALSCMCSCTCRKENGSSQTAVTQKDRSCVVSS